MEGPSEYFDEQCRCGKYGVLLYQHRIILAWIQGIFFFIVIQRLRSSDNQFSDKLGGQEVYKEARLPPLDRRVLRLNHLLSTYPLTLHTNHHGLVR